MICGRVVPERETFTVVKRCRVCAVPRSSGGRCSGSDAQPRPCSNFLPLPSTRRLCDYLYELSEKFNSFYVECKVLGSPEEDSRLVLVEATAVVMRQCFYLLGITPLYKI
eukprot:365760-Chlamydomonas_euryale.AAC.6